MDRRLYVLVGIGGIGALSYVVFRIMTVSRPDRAACLFVAVISLLLGAGGMASLSLIRSK